MEEEKKEVLVIKSDKEWLQYFRIRVNGVILFILMEIVVEVVFNYDLWKSRAITHEIAVTLEKCVALMFIIANIFLVLNIYRIWRNIGRKLVLDKTGIWTKICFYEKKYEWKDFKIRQLRKNLGEFCYDEGVFFAVYKRQPRQNSNCEFFPIRYPMGGFNINFKMHRPILVTSRNYTIYINGEIMAVEKEELLSKLKEWGVDFETERPKNFDIFQDKKGRLQSRRNGTAWILLAAAIWLLLLGFIIYPIFIWKNLVLIAIFIPFFIALVPVYVVVTSRKSYRLKMDEKGCIRTFLFLSKRYLWKDLRVKLIASEESHCGEGVLFIKKKSGNSSSASETFSYASLHPYSSFVANFEVFGKMYGEKDALHEINKELFLEKNERMGSGGRRAAERRVGDEEMEEENNRILVVKSDEKWMKFRKEAVIASLILELMWCFLLKPPVVFAIVSPPMIGLVYSLFSWIQDSKVLTLNETGCCIKCFLYKKMYTWDELKNRQMRVKYGDYKESILMSTNAIPEGKYKCAMFMFQHPFNSFVINFCGLHEPFYFGTGKNGSRTYVVEGEVCAIDKDLFFKKMKEWGVAIEKVRVMDESIFYDKSGGICTRRNGYGWKIFSFVLVLIMCACLMFPIVVLKDMGMLFISIPFGIVFLIVYKVIISRKSYCLKMDEKGCTRKFLFLSKHYQWKNLRVKLVASEESHCGEGVLFIKKKSGNSSSASETFSYASLHPYSSFVANFEVFGKMYGEKDALHEINKELFLEKMKEWGVEVEGLPKEE